MTIYDCETCGVTTTKAPDVADGELAAYLKHDRLVQAVVEELGESATGILTAIERRFDRLAIAYCAPCGRYRKFEEVER